MNIGYARVSTQNQNIDLQLDALRKEGCDRVFQDICSGSSTSRSGLFQAFDTLKEGDNLVVWRLDRLGRSLTNLVQVIHDLQARDIGFKALQQNIDTTTSGGKLYFHVFASLAEFESDLLRERTMAGLASAKQRGRLGGRPKAMDTKKIQLGQKLKKNQDLSIKDICSMLDISKSTFYRYC